MIEVSLSALYRLVHGLFLANGLTEPNADAAAEVFVRATLRGAGHHDVSLLPQRIQALKTGKAVPNPSYTPLAAFGAMESWDAGGGLGEVVCTFGMERAMRLADVHGVGVAALRNTNHFLAAAPYVEKAAEQGYAALLLCKAGVTMGGPDGRPGACMSQLPMGFAYPTDQDFPVMLDICLAYSSFGTLAVMAERGEKVPLHWGLDASGAPTDDPAALAKGTRFPIGGHKGFGLAMLGEALTGVLSGGCVMDEAETPDGVANPSCHTAIAIKCGALMDEAAFRTRAGDIQRRVQAIAPDTHIPGAGNHQAKTRFMREGRLPLPETLVDTLDALARQAGIPTLNAGR